MNNLMLKYYLDTNAVRSLASHLDKCRNVGAFISVWTICEMVGHIIKNPENFKQIRNNLRAIMNSNINIVMKLPIEIHYNAFLLDSFLPKCSTSQNILKMASLTLGVENYDAWMNKISEYSLLETYKSVKEIDDATIKLNQNIENQYDINVPVSESQKEYELFIQNEDKKKTHQQLISYYVDGFIEKHEEIRKIGLMLGMSYEEFKIFLCTQYNGSIDVALRVNACIVNKKVSFRQKFKRNDDTDMFHLYYIHNCIILVTDDRALRENVVAQYLGRAISIESFKSLLD